MTQIVAAAVSVISKVQKIVCEAVLRNTADSRWTDQYKQEIYQQLNQTVETVLTGYPVNLRTTAYFISVISSACAVHSQFLMPEECENIRQELAPLPP